MSVATKPRLGFLGLGWIGRHRLNAVRDSGAAEVRRGDARGGESDCVIECAGTQEALDTAAALVAERGRLVVAGFHQDGARTVDMQSWNWRGIDVINAHERDPAVYVDAMREAAELAAAGDLDVAALVTHRFPLARLEEAFEAARTRPTGFVKAWVAP